MNPSLIPNSAAFYAALRARREELGLHHLELDDYAGIADGHMSKIEMFDATYGKRPFNITETAETVLQALDLALVVMPREEAARLTSGTVDRKIHQRAGRNEGRAVVLSWAVRYGENATDK